MIVLIGFMGAGKTTVGRLLAGQLGCDFVDSDEAIVAEHGLSIAELFATRGEASFRRLEAETIDRLLRGPQVVLALGGGAVQTPAVRAVLAGHRVVLLDVGFAEALARVGNDAGRPMLARRDLLEVYRARQEAYARCATAVVSSVGTPADVTADVLARLGHGRPGTVAARPVVVEE